jgi:hypothetical protein
MFLFLYLYVMQHDSDMIFREDQESAASCLEVLMSVLRLEAHGG